MKPLEIPVASSIQLQRIVGRLDLNISSSRVDELGQAVRIAEYRVEDEQLRISIHPLFEADDG